MCQDRINENELKLTQEFIAEMLGIRRATVSLAAMVLQNEGLIQYNREHIKSLTCLVWKGLLVSAITQRELSELLD